MVMYTIGRVSVFGCDHDHETQILSHILTCESPSPAKRLEPTNICLCEELAIKALTPKVHLACLGENDAEGVF